MAKIRDLADECSGPGHAYLGHMQDPEILRKGHNTDEGTWLGDTLNKVFGKVAGSGSSGQAGASAPTGSRAYFTGKDGVRDFSRNPDGSAK